MRKFFLLAFIGLFSSFTMAQLTSKKGETILPETGDIALGFNAAPVFVYFGNLFNGNTFNNSPAFGFADSSLSIYAKKYTADDRAIRASVRLGVYSQKSVTLVDDALSTDEDDLVENDVTTRAFDLTLSAGIEKRRGSTRVQGFYGGEGFVGIRTDKKLYNYGNQASDEAPPGTERPIEVKQGNLFLIGARAFLGAEYFFLPKMSFGIEYGFGFAVANRGFGEITTETVNPNGEGSNLVTSKDITSEKLTIVSLDNSVSNTQIKFLFHF